MIRVSPGITIEDSEIAFEFIRASGPGGQNVNKVATAVRLTFDIRASRALSNDVRERLEHLAGRRVGEGGVLAILARRHRTQEANRRDAIERLTELILRAVERPKDRRKTRPSRASRQRRLEAKRLRGQKKVRRQAVGHAED